LGHRFLFTLLLLAPALFIQDLRAQDLLERYFAANARQADKTRDVHMDMDFDARLLKLNKAGHLTGSKFISKTGQIHYAVKSITGDDSVKKHVIARYLSGEQENSVKPLDVGINPHNYKFKFKKIGDQAGRPVHVYEVQPRKKRVGLYKGELWIDEETALPVRETGEFSKSPSPVFLKKVTFTRQYSLVEGVAQPARIESVIETRIVGKAEIIINFTNYKPGGDQPTAEPPAATNQ
jgi:hypothetical protein